MAYINVNIFKNQGYLHDLHVSFYNSLNNLIIVAFMIIITKITLSLFDNSAELFIQKGGGIRPIETLATIINI